MAISHEIMRGLVETGSPLPKTQKPAPMDSERACEQLLKVVLYVDGAFNLAASDDLDFAWLQGFGHFAHQIDVQ